MTPRSPKLLRTHRQTAVLIEHAKVTLEGGRVVYTQSEDGVRKTFNLPFANVAVLFLGQGTSLTQPAVQALAKEGVYVAFTGTGGAPLHMGDLTHYQVTGHMWRMIEVARDPALSLEAARIIMRHRIAGFREITPKVAKGLMKRPLDLGFVDRDLRKFGKKVEAARSTQEMMAHEAAFAKSAYKAFASSSGIPKFTRSPGGAAAPSAEPDARIALANRRIDHGNYIAYGIAGSCLWSLGIPHGLSVLHGKTRAGGLVFDLADSFKDSLVLPFAFAGIDDESEYRRKLVAAIQDTGILARCHAVMSEILELAPEGETNIDFEDRPMAPSSDESPKGEEASL